jgi:alpha-N-arabinofuranosidase
MKHLLEKHSAIMDEFDPERRVGLVVDEWGTWYDVEAGTEPGFLYQQNTLRDALVAGVNLNLFNQHCERVTMANIAQTVNVLQAMVLTDGPRMCVTPTYHAFEMYQPHQGARLVPVTLEGHPYTMGKTSVPMLHASASLDSASRLHLSLVNVEPNRGAQLTVSKMTGSVTGRVLTAPQMNAHSDVSRPNCVEPETFTDFSLSDGTLTVHLPPKSLIVLEGRP